MVYYKLQSNTSHEPLFVIRSYEPNELYSRQQSFKNRALQNNYLNCHILAIVLWKQNLVKLSKLNLMCYQKINKEQLSVQTHCEYSCVNFWQHCVVAYRWLLLIIIFWTMCKFVGNSVQRTLNIMSYMKLKSPFKSLSLHTRSIKSITIFFFG